VRACLLLAVQADGHRVLTVEGLADLDGPSPAGAGPPVAGLRLHPLQEAFRRRHGLQCGFCTPGILLAAYAFLREHPEPTVAEIREMLGGHLCRCTGYHFIVEAIAEAARTWQR
jgi:carbon-monoxide dehydrogenase small subunit